MHCQQVVQTAAPTGQKYNVIKLLFFIAFMAHSSTLSSSTYTYKVEGVCWGLFGQKAGVNPGQITSPLQGHI